MENAKQRERKNNHKQLLLRYYPAVCRVMFQLTYVMLRFQALKHSTSADRETTPPQVTTFYKAMRKLRILEGSARDPHYLRLLNRICKFLSECIQLRQKQNNFLVLSFFSRIMNENLECTRARTSRKNNLHTEPKLSQTQKHIFRRIAMPLSRTNSK